MERDGADLIPWVYIMGTKERCIVTEKGGCFEENGKTIPFKRGNFFVWREDPYNEMVEVARRMILPN